MRNGFAAMCWMILASAPVSAQYRPYSPPLPVNPPSPMGLPIPLRPLDPSRAAPPVVRPSPRPLPPGLPLPPGVLRPPSVAGDGSITNPNRVEAPLPQPERKISIDSGAVTMKRINGSWQVWCGRRMLRNLGADEVGAREIVRLLQDQHPTEWVSIGVPRPIVEYALTNGRPSASLGFPRSITPIDLRSVRVEGIRGVWCLRDDANILFNFGLNRADADQALAVVRRYGFNRVGRLGNDPQAPVLTYFAVSLDADGAKPAQSNPLLLASQEMNLGRTGIPVPGIGYIGEMIPIDYRKTEVRRDGADYVVACNTEVLARFGRDQNGARDLQRLIQDCRYTEFCRAGPGVNFFLTNGQSPLRLPLYVSGKRFDRNGLKLVKLGDRLTVADHGRPLFNVRNQQEGEAVIALMKHFQFDRLCQVGSSPVRNLTFLARSR